MEEFFTIRSEKELAAAIREEREEIYIEGDLSKKIIRIKATGKVAWGICVVALAGVVVMGGITILSGGSSGPGTATAGLMSLAPATAFLGFPTAVSAALVCLAGGGVGVLNKLRRYSLVDLHDGKVVLRRHELAPSRRDTL